LSIQSEKPHVSCREAECTTAGTYVLQVKNLYLARANYIT